MREHSVLKLERKNRKARSDEIQRHLFAGGAEEPAGGAAAAGSLISARMADGRR